METHLIDETVKINETLKKIYERRSIRKYKSQPIERKFINQLIDAGRMAPSALNKQPWKFYILTKKEDIDAFEKQIEKIAAKKTLNSGLKNILKTSTGALQLAHGVDFLKAENPIFHAAPVVIFISSSKDDEWSALDIGLCSQNMMLAAKSLGIDSCPIGLGKYVEQIELFVKLKVPKTEQIHLALIFGYGDEKPVLTERIKNNAFYID